MNLPGATTAAHEQVGTRFASTSTFAGYPSTFRRVTDVGIEPKVTGVCALGGQLTGV